MELGRFRPIFTEAQEEELMKHLLEMEQQFFGLTRYEFRRLVYSYAEANNIKHSFNREKGVAGKDWLNGFLKKKTARSIFEKSKKHIIRSGFWI